jgi:hypothetical protein
MRIPEAHAAESKSIPRPRSKAGITVHHYTSVYINVNEVERRLGTNIAIYSGYILLTFSQITLSSTCRHPRARCGWKEPSQ